MSLNFQVSQGEPSETTKSRSTANAVWSEMGPLSPNLKLTANFQTVFTFMRRLPRAIYAIVTVAVIIPVAIEAAKSFFSALESFIGVIAYWAAAYAIIVVVEHSHFRGNSAATYDIAIWEDGKALPTGIPAVSQTSGFSAHYAG